MYQQLSFAPEVLHVLPWRDDVIDHLGFDARSGYVEDYWLGILGPSTTWLVRRMAAGFEYSPDGFDLDLAETARSLGLSDRSGRSSAFLRALNRLVQFNLAQLSGPDELMVRRRVPPLTRAQVYRLSPALQARHTAWQEEQLRLGPDEQQLCRARQLALSLLELGEDYDGTERQLLRWRYPPQVAREAATWACTQRAAGVQHKADGGEASGAEASGGEASGGEASGAEASGAEASGGEAGSSEESSGEAIEYDPGNCDGANGRDDERGADGATDDANTQEESRQATRVLVGTQASRQ